MQKAIKRAALAVICLALMLCTGCSFYPSEGSLYRLPKLPAEYESLETLIDSLLADGAEYAAPTSGSNLQSVQMVDLDGDGQEEAVAFFRKASDEKPMKIYIFRAVGESYEQMCLLEGTATSIYSINYTDLTGDGQREIIVGLRGNLDMQYLTAYTITSGEPRVLLSTGYFRYAARDVDGDGKQELIIIRSDDESLAQADYYAWNGEQMMLTSSLQLSMAATELRRMSAGALAGGESALFVTGVSEDNSAVTDVFTVRGDRLQSVVRGSTEQAHFLDLFPADINDDGVTEVPMPVPFPRTDEDSPVYYRVRWQQYDTDGRDTVVCQSYENQLDGWRLILPDYWINRVTLSRSSNAEGSEVSFYLLRSGGENVKPLLTIYTYTGERRNDPAFRNGKILLSRQMDAVYAADLMDDAGKFMNEQILRDNFYLVTSEWITGEN